MKIVLLGASIHQDDICVFRAVVIFKSIHSIYQLLDIGDLGFGYLVHRIRGIGNDTIFPYIEKSVINPFISAGPLHSLQIHSWGVCPRIGGQARSGSRRHNHCPYLADIAIAGDVLHPDARGWCAVQRLKRRYGTDHRSILSKGKDWQEGQEYQTDKDDS